MFLASFPAGPWQANCYVFGFAEGRVVVVDPGVDALAPVQRLVAEHELSVEAVLLTHGHIDHVAQAADVADHFGVPAHLHVLDRPLLSDPTSGRPQMRQMVAQLGVEVREPADLRLLEGGETLTAAGATFTVVHAPGHRPGCVLFRVPLAEPVEEAPELTELIFTGDVVFAGSIGRTDLPGGDDAAMRATLRDVVVPLPDTAALLPGHGPTTTMGHERITNRYLDEGYLS
ncbi:MAG TPA: MBL fold metallo-hydrolase [Propioniciclava sp.]|jgi:hydroxyacylglutathione hydrolase|uniref:MBL fold metallo-hydrolase n=1 Tax=Propioniciclava sp. TaxID=2038686 RepID=UPI002C223213|nr:MBL fold metallo-hydrolase [Propioniciclava sp.]HRL49159.1 MBL fold metallo-hydrolase [Propioniciclava sp.]HRL79156.1 MBL fold metallo-hydrolase [Propioniciclava sp.]